VYAIGAAAGQGMTAAVNEPMLHHNSSGLVSGYCAGMGPARGGLGLRTLHAVICLSLRLDDVCGIRRMDDVIPIAMKDDGPHARGVI
jgi:hypothetical protein